MAMLLAVSAVAAALFAGSVTRAATTDASAPVDASAPAQTGTLELKSDPPGAEIVIDQNKTGVHTPGSVTLAAGQHQLTLRSPNPKDYKDRSLTITIVAGKPTRLTLDLVHVPH